MVDFLPAAVGLGCVLGVTLLLARLERWWPLALGLAALAVGLAVGLQVLPQGAPLASWRGLDLAVLLGWLMLGAGARKLRPRLWGPLGLQAVVAGLVLGDLGAAALMAGLVEDPEKRARAALVASGAALLSPIGTPATLLMARPWELGLLPLALILVVWPRGEASSEGRIAVTVGLAAVAGLALWSPLVVAVAGLGVALWTRQLPWRAMVWLAGLSVVAAAAQSSGAVHQLGLGLDYLVLAAGPDLAHLALAGAVSGIALLSGEAPAALVFQQVIEANHLFKDPALPALLAASVGVGGLIGGPRALRLWWRQLAVLLVWVLFAL